MAGGGKKEKGEGLGRALIRQRRKAAAAAKERGEALAFGRRRAMPLESVIDVSDIDAVLQQAAEADQLAEAASVSVSDCFTISNLITKGYLNGQYDEVSVVYTRFVSMLTQTPARDALLPLEKLEAKAKTGVRQLVLYEPNPSAVYDAIVPNYIAGMIYGAMCESVASELGARRTAMDAASKNASEMIDDLSLRYNRARQGAITQEITEIVAGAEH